MELSKQLLSIYSDPLLWSYEISAIHCPQNKQWGNLCLYLKIYDLWYQIIMSPISQEILLNPLPYKYNLSNCRLKDQIRPSIQN